MFLRELPGGTERGDLLGCLESAPHAIPYAYAAEAAPYEPKPGADSLSGIIDGVNAVEVTNRVAGHAVRPPVDPREERLARDACDLPELFQYDGDEILILVGDQFLAPASAHKGPDEQAVGRRTEGPL